ncbi:hypothetical protein FNF28_00807 [Cafeteria roenbergensis]|uniref:Nudix hydrolase domain-containing protein n=1 Tax=Cafeteria roenbergensis TaxID=33653 RepID=A0A5A8E0K8_CAFRO|nr:hypothetical protein FNF28_00807 [Cafeteria roenbergensis]
MSLSPAIARMRSCCLARSGRLASSLAAAPAPFDSVRVTVTDAASVTPTEIQEQIGAARSSGRLAVWVALSGEETALLPQFLEAGFRVHSGGGSEVDCYIWTGRGEDKVPPYATHTVAVAAVVTDSEGRLLVVNEHRKRAAWKFPGGYVDPGEDISVAAARELREETSVQAVPRTVLAIRHQHGLGRRGDVGDLYVLLHLEATTTDIAIQHTDEIAAARWITLEEFEASSVHPMNQYMAGVVREALRRRGAGEAAMGLEPDRIGKLADPADKVAFLRPADWEAVALSRR